MCWTANSYFPLLQAPGNHHSALYENEYFRSLIEVALCSSCFILSYCMYSWNHIYRQVNSQQSECPPLLSALAHLSCLGMFLFQMFWHSLPSLPHHSPHLNDPPQGPRMVHTVRQWKCRIINLQRNFKFKNKSLSQRKGQCLLRIFLHSSWLIDDR